ncbi:DUF6350 family protein [Aquipuribacter hungaricus]|uniref:cell division protein PerM n=1 Tax=Aquipuribacter hungaricus TaxID=545624 RepID=UPI0036220188
MSSARTPTARRPAEAPAHADRVPARGHGQDGPGEGGRGRLAGLGDAFADLRLAVSLAVGGIAVGLVVCVGLLVLGWVSDPAAETGWAQAVRLGTSAWLLAHLGDLGVTSLVVTSTSPGDPPTEVASLVSLPPLLLVALAVWPVWRAGRRTASRGGPVRSLLLVLVMALVWAGAAWALAWAVDTPVVTPDPTACALGAAVLVVAAALPAVLLHHRDELLGRLPRHVEVQVARVVPAAGVALAGWLLGGAVLLSAALLLDLTTVGQVQTSLAPGLGGGLALLLLQLVFLPTAVLWAAAVLAGPGTWVGAGHVGPGGSGVVDVPAVPLLAALPSPGELPLWAFLAPAAVVAAGALAAWHAHRDPTSRGATLGDRAGDAVAMAALAVLRALGLGWLSSGALGPWQPLGPDPLVLAAAVAVEVFAGALLAGCALHLLSGRPLGRWSRLSGRLRQEERAAAAREAAAAPGPVSRSSAGLRPPGRPVPPAGRAPRTGSTAYGAPRTTRPTAGTAGTGRPGGALR